MPLNKNALGLSMGLLWGGCVLIATVWVMMRGGGEHLELLNKFYFGYAVSPAGAILGLVWGFIDGFISGWILAWLYNRFSGASAQS